jgi:hypothetical protein
MSLTAIPKIKNPLMQTWRLQIGQKARYATQRGVRPFGIVSYRVRDPQPNERFVCLSRLTIVALFDEQLESSQIATRLIGVGGSLNAQGIQFGGPGNSRFDKDLRLAPTFSARGKRLDIADVDFLSFALALEMFLERSSRHPHVPRRRSPVVPALPIGTFHNGSCNVDLSALPKRQIVAIESPSKNLCGHCGTTAFDLVHTRFREAC